MDSTATRTQIARWLSGQVASHLDVPATEIDPAMPLAELGLDSVSAVGLCGDIEQRWRIEADPILVYDYPTIAEIAGFVAGRIVAEDEGRR